MKNLILFLGFLITCTAGLQAQADAIAKYFDKYADDERFSTVYISPAMFKMAADMDEGDMDSETKELLSKLEGVRILTAEDIDGTKFFKEAISTIDTDQYEVFMEVRDGKENVKFLTRRDEDSIEEILMLVGEPDEFVMISFVGSVGPEDLSKIGKTFNLDMGEFNMSSDKQKESKEN